MITNYNDCIWAVSPEDRQCEFCVYRDCGQRQERKIQDMPSVLQAEWYIEVMTEIVGKDFLTSCRRSEYVWARNIVAYQLAKDGITHRVVADSLGLARCSISHCVRRVKEMLSNARFYPKEMEIWRRFQELSYLHKQ